MTLLKCVKNQTLKYHPRDFHLDMKEVCCFTTRSVEYQQKCWGKTKHWEKKLLYNCKHHRRRLHGRKSFREKLLYCMPALCKTVIQAQRTKSRQGHAFCGRVCVFAGLNSEWCACLTFGFFLFSCGEQRHRNNGVHPAAVSAEQLEEKEPLLGYPLNFWIYAHRLSWSMLTTNRVLARKDTGTRNSLKPKKCQAQSCSWRWSNSTFPSWSCSMRRADVHAQNLATTMARRQQDLSFCSSRKKITRSNWMCCNRNNKWQQTSLGLHHLRWSE